MRLSLSQYIQGIDMEVITWQVGEIISGSLDAKPSWGNPDIGVL